MKNRLPTRSSLYGNNLNVHTTHTTARNMTESLPREESEAIISAQNQVLGDVSQDDNLPSTRITYQENSVPSNVNVAASYKDPIDAISACTKKIAENRTRKVQIDVPDWHTDENNLQSHLELLDEIHNAVEEFEEMFKTDPEPLSCAGSGNSEMDKSSSSRKRHSDSVPDQDREKEDTHDRDGSITIVDGEDLDGSPILEKSVTDNANDSTRSGSTNANEHDSSYPRKDYIISHCLLLIFCITLIGICLFYYHSHCALLSKFKDLEGERNLLKFEILMIKPDNSALIDNCYFNIWPGNCSDGLIQSTYDWYDWIMSFFF